MVSQCTIPGFVENHETVWMAKAMSGHIPIAAYTAEPTASW
jgi:hypothetical protein